MPSVARADQVNIDKVRLFEIKADAFEYILELDTLPSSLGSPTISR